MDNQNKEMAVTPIEAISYCQNKLGNIPLGNIPATLAQCSAIIQPINEVVVILEKVKQALVAEAPKPEVHPEPKKTAPQKKPIKKAVFPPKAEA